MDFQHRYLLDILYRKVQIVHNFFLPCYCSYWKSISHSFCERGQIRFNTKEFTRTSKSESKSSNNLIKY